MNLFRDLGAASSDDLPPGDDHASVMELKGASPAKSTLTIIAETVPHAVPASVLRRIRRGKNLQSGTPEALKTQAELKVLDSKRLELDFDATAVREGILRCTITDLTNFYLPGLLEQRELRRHDPRKLTWYTHFSVQGHYRVATESHVPKDRMTHLHHAMDANRKLLEAARRAGSSVSPLYESIALTNDPAIEWQILQQMDPQAGKDVLFPLCSRGKKACDAAAEKFPFWIRPRRDANEYTGCLLFMEPTEEMRKELDQEVLLLAKAFKGAPILDVLLMLRANMEPAARKMLKASKTHQRLVEANAERQSPLVLITPKLLRKLEA